VAKYDHVPDRAQQQGVQPTNRCGRCGWDFLEEHWEPSTRGGKRKVTRPEIRIASYGPGGIVRQFYERCGDCYLYELHYMNKAQFHDHPEVRALQLSGIPVTV
jgi:hypothetical protein